MVGMEFCHLAQDLNVCSTLKYVKCHEFPDNESVTVQLFILKRSNHILQAHYSVVILS